MESDEVSDESAEELPQNEEAKDVETVSEDESMSEEPRLSNTKLDKHVNKSGKKDKKPKEPGIIYLSFIPRLMNVKKIREIFGQYGELGRVFLQPDKPSKKGKPSKFFTEGWVEFKDKRVAKKITLFLNGKQIGGKRRCPWYDSLWSIKYLHGFKWTHLSEKLSYEKAVHEQKLRNEISQAKKEANFYAHTVEKTQREKRIKAKIEKEEGVVDNYMPQFETPVYQKPTDNEMRQKSARTKKVDKNFLQSVFGGGE